MQTIVFAFHGFSTTENAITPRNENTNMPPNLFFTVFHFEAPRREAVK